MESVPMRLLLGMMLFFGLVIGGGYVFIKKYPLYLYSQWATGARKSELFTLKNPRPLLLTPTTSTQTESYQEDYAQLWKDFPLGHISLPLPVRHPLFQTIPVLEMSEKKSSLKLGIKILDPNDREVSRITLVPPFALGDPLEGQKLFRLPVVRNELQKISQEKVWRDLFSRKIVIQSKPVLSMLYDLYILNLRSRLLPAHTVGLTLLDEERALIEVQAKNKDYIQEVVLHLTAGGIYSYVILTQKKNQESQKLRSKFLNSIRFGAKDDSMAKILYQEFKQLNFSRQTDQEGMLYLLSAWSMDLNKVNYLKEMIFYLERGKNNHQHLKDLYLYAFKKFGNTFSTQKTFAPEEDQGMVLQRKIDIEARERALKTKITPTEEEKPTRPMGPDERMDLFLKEAKKNAPEKKNQMIIP